MLVVEHADITEITGADVLYHPTGIILESEGNAAALFGTGRTVYSAEGSSLPIRAMVYLTALYAAEQGSRPLIAAGRNAHKVFITSAALLDVDVHWLYPEKEGTLLSCEITPRGLEAYLKAPPGSPQRFMSPARIIWGTWRMWRGLPGCAGNMAVCCWWITPMERI